MAARITSSPLRHLAPPLTLGLTWLLCWAFHPQAWSQDIEQTYGRLRERLKNDPITIHGGLNGQLQFNSISGAPARRDPFNYFLSGHLQLDILGVQAPLSLAFADGNTTYRLPAYALVGLSPSYKWATLHLFRRNLHFSDYTFSDHGFNGVGLELKPGRLRVMGMYGQLRKARLEDYGYRQELDPHYTRRGYALRLGYQHQQDELYATVFKAADDPASLTLHDSLGIRPQENVVLGLEGKKHVSKSLTLKAEYAYSLLSPLHPWPGRAAYKLERLFSPFMPVNATSQSSSAYNFGIDFSPVKTWALSIQYERVNPNFISLGTLNYRNDFENATVGYRGLLAKKIALQGRMGIERNNLDQHELESRRRFLLSAQVNVPVTPHWQNGLAYTNFRQTTRIIANTDPLNPVDSIFLGSINHQWSYHASYQLRPAQRLMLSATLQSANSILYEQITAATSTIKNASLSYHYAPPKAKLSGQASLLWHNITQSTLTTAVWSPAISVQYKPQDKLQCTFLLMNNFVRQQNTSGSQILRLQFTTQYTLSKQQKILLRLQGLRRSGAVSNNFSEGYGTLGYSWSF